MNRRNHSVDLFRFLFAIGIALGHVCGALHVGAFLKNYYVIVECFFVMSGYFLFASASAHEEERFIDFVARKVARLWPVLVSVSLLLFLLGRIGFTQLVVECFFMHGVGLTSGYRGINWFVFPLFWSLMLYWGICRAVTDGVKRCLLVSVMAFVAYVIVLQAGDGAFGRGFAYGFLPRTLMRGIAGVGLGYLLGVLSGAMGTRMDRMNRLVATGVETLFLALLFVNLFYAPWACDTQLVVVLAFSVVLLFMVGGRGYVFAFLNRPIFGILGRYAYSIYVASPLAFMLFDWMCGRCLSLSSAATCWRGCGMMFLILVFGVVFYHLVEVPGAALINGRRGNK